MAGDTHTVVIVGASVAGWHAAQTLRGHGFAGRVVVVGAEPHLPYDRPPLSKQVLTGARHPDQLAFVTEDRLAELDVTIRLGQVATRLRPDRVELADGAELRYDDLIVATGLSPRRLPGQPDDPRVHLLRTRDDALRLREQFDSAGSLLVVGGGFIGSEVAASARQRGLDVHVVEADPVPMFRSLGERVGALCAELHRENGTTVRTGVLVRSLTGDTGGITADLADGTRLTADLAVVGLGATPNVQWLADSGADLTDGVLCDGSGRVLHLDRVWAIGDLARWADPTTGGTHRTEHWTSARNQADAVARCIAGVPPAERPAMEYVWSDQYRVKIQVSGRPELADSEEPLVIVPDSVRGNMIGYFRNGRLVAVVTFGSPRLFNQISPLVGAGREVVMSKVDSWE